MSLLNLGGVAEETVKKGAKITTGIMAGGTSMILVVSMMNSRLDEMNKQIERNDKQVREYVNFRHDQLIRELSYLKENQAEIKDLLKSINFRVRRGAK